MAQILVKEFSLRDDLKEAFTKNGVDYKCRSIGLGHTLRSGTSNAFDRILELKFGLKAMKLVLEEDLGRL